MFELRSYIVRIYRQGYQSLGGVVEDLATQGHRPFRSGEELIELLRTSIPRTPQPQSSDHNPEETP